MNAHRYINSMKAVSVKLLCRYLHLVIAGAMLDIAVSI